MSQGVILMAFGKPIYGAFAYNMALSIKHHNPELPIHLIYEKQALMSLEGRHYKYFDSFSEIAHEDLYDGKIINPGKAKVSLYKYLPFKESIYLDVDGAALKDLQPLFDRCSALGQHFYSQCIGYHTIEQGREIKPMVWAWADDIWSHYSLPDDAVLPATNSSFLFIRKCRQSERLYENIKENYIYNPLPLDRLRYKWGGSYPDELALNIALAQLNIDPSPGFSPVYFNLESIKDYSHLESHYLLGLFGGAGFSHHTLLNYYDRLIHSYSLKQENRNIEFKAHLMIKSKHANKR